MKHLQIIITGFLFIFLSLGSASAANVYHKTKKAHTHASPKIGAKVLVVDKSATVVVHNHKNYRYHNGTFYMPGASGFVVVAPPVGIVVRKMPSTVVVVRHRGKKYYRCGGSYFILKRGKYHCVKAPF